MKLPERFDALEDGKGGYYIVDYFDGTTQYDHIKYDHEAEAIARCMNLYLMFHDIVPGWDTLERFILSIMGLERIEDLRVKR
jgi:hypothetical protein